MYSHSYRLFMFMTKFASDIDQDFVVPSIIHFCRHDDDSNNEDDVE